MDIYKAFAKEHPVLFEDFRRQYEFDKKEIRKQRDMERQRLQTQLDALRQLYTYQYSFAPARIQCFYLDPRFADTNYAMVLNGLIESLILFLKSVDVMPVSIADANPHVNMQGVDLTMWAYNPEFYRNHLLLLCDQIRTIHSSISPYAWSSIYGAARIPSWTRHELATQDTYPLLQFLTDAIGSLNKRIIAGRRILFAWKRAYYNPSYRVCQNRLKREFHEMIKPPSAHY